MVRAISTLSKLTFLRVISGALGLTLIVVNLSAQRPTAGTVVSAAPVASPVAPVNTIDKRTLDPGSQTEESLALTPGAPAARDISSGQSHSYLIALNIGDYVRIAISSREIDLTPEFFALDSAKAVGIYGSHLTGGSKTVSLIAEVAGNHRLRLRPASNDAKTGRYEVKIETLRPATELDRGRLEAERTEGVGVRRKDLAPEQWREAIADFQAALALWRKAEDRQGQLRMLTRLGSEYTQLGEQQLALEQFKEAIQIARSLGDRYQEANLLLGFGNIHHYQNENQQALDAYNQARQIFASRSARFGEALAIESIGLTYLNLGDVQLSLEHLKHAAQTYSSFKFTGAQCNTMNGIGAVYSRMGQPQQALESYAQALALARESKATACEGRAHRQMGDVYLNLGERQKALESFNEALTLCGAVGNRVCEAAALRGIGSISWLNGDHEKSLDLLGQAQNKFRLSGERSQEAFTLHIQARVNESLGNLNESRAQIEQSLDLMESVRANVASQKLRESFFVSAQSGFSFYIDLLMRLHQRSPSEGYDALALRANERAHARGLLEILAEAGADIRKGVSQALLELEQSLLRQINAKAAACARLPNDKRAENQAASLNKEILELTSRYYEVEAQIRVASPHYAALTQSHPVSAEVMQRELLDENTVLLEIALGSAQSWLWAATSKSLDNYRLPPEAEIEAAARRVYDLLTSRQPKKDLTELQRQKFVIDSDAKFTTETSSLSRMLLGPIATRLCQEWKGKRLLFVLSGALEYLPFSALPLPEIEKERVAATDRPVPTSSSRASLPSSPRPVPLIVNHEIVNLPSASALAALRREVKGRNTAVKTLAIIADPVFEPSDPRVLLAAKEKKPSVGIIANVRSADSDLAPEPQAKKSGETNDTVLARGMRGFNRAGFSRLPFSREEANAISELIPKSSLFKATDFQASRGTAISGALSGYRILHFATHGMLNSEHPELSGLVLSLVDKNGKPQDGFLQMSEIYNLQLPADVVVLSACQTALGKQVKGEGLVGLTRGFMHAGAQRIVASLWQVDDLATAELMKRFYRGMLKEKMRPAAVLRAAQIEMSRNPRWAAPYFWAGFIMQGEYK